MRQRIVYVWLPRLATDRIVRRESALRDMPLAVVADVHQGSCLYAINDVAQTAGVTPGMMLSGARTICPGLVVRPLELDGDRKTLAGIAQWCRSFTPLVARDGMQGLFLDITGCVHLFGGERAMLGALRSRLSGFGFNVFTALADTAGAAWALARFGSCETVAPCEATAPCGRTAKAIGPLPVAGLRLDVETADMLARLGLKRIEDLYGLARASLAARFGMELVLRLDQALGAAPEPLEFDRCARAYRTSFRFLEPISLLRDVETSLEHMLCKLCERLSRDGLGARRLVLSLTRVDNSVAHVEVGTVAPNRIVADLMRLFRDRLETLDAGFGFERVSLHAATVQAIGASQTAFSDGEKIVPGRRAALVDRLMNRLGPGGLRAYGFGESHMPERAFTIHAPGASSVPSLTFGSLITSSTSSSLRRQGPTRSTVYTVQVGNRLGSRLHGNDAEGGVRSGANCWGQNTRVRANVARPLRLYDRPVAIGFGKAGREGGKSMSVFGRSHTIRSLDGPERIASEWWHNEPVWSSGLREYWWVVNDEGQRLWIFKQQDEGGCNRWFLHGLGA